MVVVVYVWMNDGTDHYGVFGIYLLLFLLWFVWTTGSRKLRGYQDCVTGLQIQNLWFVLEQKTT